MRGTVLVEEGIFSGSGLSAAVLAGGASRRFGREKAQAKLLGRPLIGHVLTPLRGLFEEILIVANRPEFYEGLDLQVVSDIWRGTGPLGGLFTALLHARNPHCFAVACDMPLLNPAVVRLIVQRCPGYDVVVPSVEGELEPLHALYSKRCLPFIRRGIQAGAYRIVEFYPMVSVLKLDEHHWKDLDPDNLSFLNVNTVEDFQTAESRLMRMREKIDAGGNDEG